jgi:hypothetical protein
MEKIDQKEREAQKEERKKLEKILDFVADDIEALTVEAEEIIKKKEKVTLNYNELKADVDDEAFELVTQAAAFYFTKGDLEKELYIIKKIQADKLTISNLLFQMKTSEHAIIKLLELIDEGNVHPRQFEVLSSLQRSKMDIVKHLATILTMLEENYKRLSHDYLMKGEQTDMKIIGESSKEDEDTLLTYGSKDLIKTIRSVVDKQKEEDE